MSFNGKTILMVMAHPDDEVIFGWPILQDHCVKKKILCCSSDFNNHEREWCKYRKDSLFDLCNTVGIEVKCLDYNSEFYRMETRKESLSRMLSDISDMIQTIKPFDFVYTHNFWGEYGHIDHILVNNLCMTINSPLLISNMFCQSNWVPYTNIPFGYHKIFDQSTKCSLNIDFYNKMKYFYESKNVWTWSKDPIRECLIAEIPGNEHKNV